VVESTGIPYYTFSIERCGIVTSFDCKHWYGLEDVPFIIDSNLVIQSIEALSIINLKDCSPIRKYNYRIIGRNHKRIYVADTQNRVIVLNQRLEPQDTLRFKLNKNDYLMSTNGVNYLINRNYKYVIKTKHRSYKIRSEGLCQLTEEFLVVGTLKNWNYDVWDLNGMKKMEVTNKYHQLEPNKLISKDYLSMFGNAFLDCFDFSFDNLDNNYIPEEIAFIERIGKRKVAINYIVVKKDK
jgi:hypothetical protein